MLDLGIDLNVWPWVWLTVAVFFAVIELTVLAGSFILLPFSLSAFIASLLGFYDVAIEIQWFAFLVGGGVLWIVMYRYAQRFAGANEVAPGVGADRLLGMPGIVTSAIDPDDTDRRGRVTISGEVWGALADDEQLLAKGSKVRVVAVNGTRVVVEPTGQPPTTPPTGPPPPPPHQPPPHQPPPHEPED